MQLFPAPSHKAKRGSMEDTDGEEGTDAQQCFAGYGQTLQGRYCLHALRHLVDVASNADPEHPEPWGWCRYSTLLQDMCVAPCEYPLF